MRLAACLLILTLAACGGPDDEEQAADTPPGVTTAELDDVPSAELASDGETARIAISLEGEGLRMILTKTGSARPLEFGTDRAVVERAVGSTTQGDPVRETNVECPAGAMEFSRYGDLTLNFQDDEFVGWSIDDGSNLTTMDGIGIGSTRAEIEGSRTTNEQTDSTLGEELLIGGMSALMNGPGANARVTDLWAGTNCVFR